MKTFIRFFFRSLRTVLGPVMLLKEKLTQPKGLSRPPAAQQKVDQQCKSLTLYQYQTCPFCIKVRQEMSRLSLNIQRIDAQHEGPDRQALLKGGGQTKVPSLKITDKAGKTHCVIHKSKTLYKSITYKRQKIEQWDSCGLRESL